MPTLTRGQALLWVIELLWVRDCILGCFVGTSGTNVVPRALVRSAFHLYCDCDAPTVDAPWMRRWRLSRDQFCIFSGNFRERGI